VLMESVIHELLCIQDTIRFTHTSSIRPFCICNKTQAVVLATFMGVHVIEIVHMGSVINAILHDQVVLMSEQLKLCMLAHEEPARCAP